MLTILDAEIVVPAMIDVVIDVIGLGSGMTGAIETEEETGAMTTGVTIATA